MVGENQIYIKKHGIMLVVLVAVVIVIINNICTAQVLECSYASN